MQFHFEIDREYVVSWCNEAGALGEGRYIQTPEKMAVLTDRYVRESNKCMYALLDSIARAVTVAGGP